MSSGSTRPDLLRKAGLNVNDIVCWEDEIEIRLPDGRGSGVFGAAPLYNPIGTLTGSWATLRSSRCWTESRWPAS